MKPRWSWIACPVFAVFFLAAHVHAEGVGLAPSSGEAEKVIQEGVDMRRLRKDAEALAAFRKAYALVPSGRALAQIALAEQALGRWIAAESDLEGALARPDDAWVQRNRDTLARGLVDIQDHLGWLEVDCNVDGAELWVNGANGGSPARRRVRVVAGSVVLEVHARGYVSAQRIATVLPRGFGREAVALVPLASVGTPQPTAPDRTSRTPPGSPVQSLSQPTKITMGRVGLVAAGAGVAALGLGTLFGVQTLAKKNERDAHCQGDRCDTTGVALDARARTLAAQATVWMGAAVVALGAGAIFFWTSRGKAASVPAASVAVRTLPALGLDRAGLELAGSW